MPKKQYNTKFKLVEEKNTDFKHYVVKGQCDFDTNNEKTSGYELTFDILISAQKIVI